MLLKSKFRKALSFILRRPEFLITIVVIFATFLFTSNSKNIIRSDGNGYYAFLTATVIYQDMSYSFFDNVLDNHYRGRGQNFRIKIDDKVVNKNWPGVAILWLPFFLIAHVISLVFGLNTDGYSLLYQYSIAASAIVYLLIGLYYLRKFLKLYAFNVYIIFLTLAIIVFATPLIHYVSKDPSFTHVYSFTLITLLFYFLKLFIIDYKAKYLLFIAGLLGLIIIVRPVNVIIILAIPFIAGDWSSTKSFFYTLFKNPKTLIFSTLILLGIIAIIPLLYKIQTDQWIIWQYRSVSNNSKSVGFRFNDINILNFLFSYRKGLFLYSPVLLFSFIGFTYLLIKKAYQALWIFVFLLFTVYLLSSWQNWWYGMSYGMRPMIDFLPVFALLFATSFKFNKSIINYGLPIIGATLIFVNIIQNYQYRKYIMFWNMNKDAYWEIFLKTSHNYQYHLWKKYTSYNSVDTFESIENKVQRVFIKEKQYEDVEDNYSDSIFYSGTKSFRLAENKKYHSIINIYKRDLVSGNTDLYYFKSSAHVYLPYDYMENKVSLVFKITNGLTINHSVHSEALQLKQNAWNEISIDVKIKRQVPDSAKFVVFLWNRGKEFYIDDFKIEVFANNAIDKESVINRYIDEIKSSGGWLEKVRNDALKKEIPLDSMIYLNAEWMYENHHK